MGLTLDVHSDPLAILDFPAISTARLLHDDLSLECPLGDFLIQRLEEISVAHNFFIMPAIENHD